MKPLFAFLIYTIICLAAGCNNPEKPKVLEKIKSYDVLINNYTTNFEKIKKEDQDIQLSFIVKLKNTFSDTSYFIFNNLKKEIIKVDFSGGEKDEVLTSLIKVQNKAYDLSILLNEFSTKLELIELDSIYARTILRAKNLLAINPSMIESLSNISKETKSKIDIRKKEVKFDLSEYIDSINTVRDALRQNPEKILE